MTTDITVEVPARPEFVRILRAVAAGVAARLEFPYDTIDDLRMAVDEASAQLLRFSGTASALRMRLTPGDRRVAVVVSIDARGLDGSWPPPDAERSLAWQVLSGLADEAGFELADGVPAVRLVKHGEMRGARMPPPRPRPTGTRTTPTGSFGDSPIPRPGRS